MPFKHHDPYQHKFGPLKYRVTNWRKYNQVLKQRGNISIWFNKEAVNKWYAKPKNRKPGGQKVYSNIGEHKKTGGNHTRLIGLPSVKNLSDFRCPLLFYALHFTSGCSIESDPRFEKSKRGKHNSTTKDSRFMESTEFTFLSFSSIFFIQRGRMADNPIPMDG